MARVLGYLLQLGVLQGWSDRVKKDWEKGQLSIAARSFLYLLYFGRVPVKSVEVSLNIIMRGVIRKQPGPDGFGFRVLSPLTSVS